jgi:hypothetical protein
MTTENNKLIAEFMELVECETDYLYHPSSEKGFLKDYLMYNSDWNWLMEVVEKIESLGSSKIMNTILYSRFEVKHNQVLLCWNKDNNYQIKIETLQDWQKGYKSTSYKDYRRVDINKDTTKLEAIYLVCVEFIKWYNENKI